jgi:hypothetical protein
MFSKLFLLIHFTVLLSLNLEREDQNLSPLSGLFIDRIHLDLPLHTKASIDDYKDRIAVKKYEGILNFLLEEIEKDKEGHILFSLKSTLDANADYVDDDNWLNLYFNIIHDLNNRGISNVA